MNTQRAKQIDFPKFLSQHGFEPVKSQKSGRELWYLSPFRSEKTPSFHTSFLGGVWLWNDFSDTGGTIIDFVMRYNDVNIEDALNYLEAFLDTAMPVEKKQAEGTPQYFEPTFRIDAIETISKTKDFIEIERGINLEVANKYFSEIVFTNTRSQKQYFGVGLKNVSEGYEVRNPFFKTSIGKKDFSFLKGQKTGSVCIFEGFMDFPSLIVDLQAFRQSKDLANIFLSTEKNSLSTDVIILNSASFKKPVLDFIRNQNYKFIHGFWDNDKTGLDLKAYFEEALGQHKVISWNHLYEPCKDYNEYLIKETSQKKW
jgi:CHC2 zinc finger/Toprim-like